MTHILPYISILKKNIEYFEEIIGLKNLVSSCYCKKCPIQNFKNTPLNILLYSQFQKIYQKHLRL